VIDVFNAALARTISVRFGFPNHEKILVSLLPSAYRQSACQPGKIHLNIA
jgi:hypothetical protein